MFFFALMRVCWLLPKDLFDPADFTAPPANTEEASENANDAVAAGSLNDIGALDHSITAEYRIFGPPGTGKTTNLTRQIRRAVERFGADSVLVTSFSRAAAAELAGRDLPINPDRIGGYDLPAGAVIAICIYALHRHPAFWDDPNLFDPERFNLERSAGRDKYAYIPFSTGPRQCLGNNFALLEAGLIMACFSQRFELHLLPGVEVKPQALFVLRPNRDLLMSLHP